MGLISALAQDIPLDAVKKAIQEVFGKQTLSEIYHRRLRLSNELLAALSDIRIIPTQWSAERVARFIADQVKCYAAILHMRYGEHPDNPGKKTNKGLAKTFEQVTEFPGRVASAAKMSDLINADRIDEPWKKGMPRMIFLSDMGDSLSNGVPFEYLKREIIDVVTSIDGKAHLWQWLTKRPHRMAKFSEWLSEQGIKWPDNLIPMMSVIDQTMAADVKQLLKIPAKARGLSVEPLWEDVEIDLIGIDWVIVGGESGSSPKPFDLQWARKLRDQCKAAGVAFFLKQYGENPVDGGKPVPKTADRHGGDWNEWPDEFKVREFPAVFRELTVPRQVKQKPVKKSAKPAKPAKLTAAEKSRFKELDGIVRKSIAAFREVGEALLEIREGDLWRAGSYKTWEDYCRAILAMSKTQANRLIVAAQVAKVLASTPIGAEGEVLEPCSEGQMRPITTIKEVDQQAATWALAVVNAGGKQPTAKEVVDAKWVVVGKSPPSGASSSVADLRMALLCRLKTIVEKQESWDDARSLVSELEKLLVSRIRTDAAASAADEDADEDADKDADEDADEDAHEDAHEDTHAEASTMTCATIVDVFKSTAKDAASDKPTKKVRSTESEQIARVHVETALGAP